MAYAGFEVKYNSSLAAITIRSKIRAVSVFFKCALLILARALGDIYTKLARNTAL